MFFEIELVTRKKNLCKKFRVSNSKCDIILRNSISYFDFVTREVRTSEETYQTVLFTLFLERSSWKIELGEFKSDQKYFAK